MGQTARKIALLALIAAPVWAASHTLCAAEQLETDPARAAQVSRDLQFKNAVGNVGNRISSMSASDEGSLWAVTSNGKLLHCLFDKTRERVRCYDRDGLATADY